MRNRIALLTEAAWSKNWLSSAESIEAFAHVLLKGLGGVRSQKAQYERGYIAILEDIQNVIARLSYGGRKPEETHPKRRAYLSKIFQDDKFCAETVTKLSA